MALRVYYTNDAGSLVEAVSRVRAVTVELVTNAEEGTVGSSRLVFDDTPADFSIRGHRLVKVVDDQINTNDWPGAGVVWLGYTADRQVGRDAAASVQPSDPTRFYSEDERWWTLNLVDINTLLDRRIMLGDDANRSAETDVARMTWLLSTTEADFITDETFVSAAEPVDMDASDYRKQRLRDIINDCAQQSGKNWYITWTDDTSQGGSAYKVALWYGKDDLETFSTSVKISNDPSDTADNATVFRPSQTTVLKRDPSRVFSGVVLDYDGGYVYAQRPETADDFATRDTTMAAPNVKTKAKATSRARRYLRDIATEEDVISTAIVVTGEQLNVIMAGQRMQAKFIHLPGYTAYTWFRVMTRTIRQLAPNRYDLALELTPPVSGVEGGALYGILYEPHGPYEGWGTWYTSTGDNPVAPGEEPRPTVGLISAILDGTPPAAARPYSGWLIGGDGDVDVTFASSIIAVYTGSHVVTWRIKKNGLTVASTTQEVVVAGLTGKTLWDTVSVADLAVTSGDVITAEVQISGVTHMVKVPGGVGNSADGLAITGGSLV